MSKRTFGILAALVLVLAVSWAPARAEVSAEVDAYGNYLRMIVTADSSSSDVPIWWVAKYRPNLRPLNPDGDLVGDLLPAVAESSGPTRIPWVVWSRSTGANYDLAFSRWNRESRVWNPIGWVQAVITPGDEVRPALAFDVDNRPYLVWSRSANGVSRVYLSVWLQTRWMDEYLVSDADEQAVVTGVRLLADRRIEVRYDTPTGRVTRIVSFNRPRTINDDITPFGRFRIDETYIAPANPR